MLSIRVAGAFAIKLMGVYYAGRVLSLYVALMVTPYLVDAEAFSASDPLLAASISSAVGSLVLALTGLLAADRIATVIFPDIPLTLSGRRRDLLFVGIVVLGLWTAADALVELLRAAAAAAYYAQQQIPAASLQRSWPQTVASIVTLGVGVGLTLGATRIAARLDAD